MRPNIQQLSLRNIDLYMFHVCELCVHKLEAYRREQDPSENLTIDTGSHEVARIERSINGSSNLSTKLQRDEGETLKDA